MANTIGNVADGMPLDVEHGAYTGGVKALEVAVLMFLEASHSAAAATAPKKID